VNNILGVTIEDFDTYHAHAADEDDCNDDKEGLVGLFESVDDIPNNEFNIDESSDQSQLFDYQQAGYHLHQTVPYEMCLDTLCHSMTSLNPILNISLGGWPLRQRK
jgi:hypothetical protein